MQSARFEDSNEAWGWVRKPSCRPGMKCCRDSTQSVPLYKPEYLKRGAWRNSRKLERDARPRGNPRQNELVPGHGQSNPTAPWDISQHEARAICCVAAVCPHSPMPSFPPPQLTLHAGCRAHGLSHCLHSDRYHYIAVHCVVNMHTHCGSTSSLIFPFSVHMACSNSHERKHVTVLCLQHVAPDGAYGFSMC